MSLRCKGGTNSFYALAFLLGAVLMHRAEASPELKVCVDTTNPTSTMDVRVARAALATQGYALIEVPFVGHGKQADDGFPVGRFAKLARADCQLIVGFPVDISNPHLPPEVKSTSAYASTGFVLVENAKSVPRKLDELPKGSEVGIAQLDTWAGLLYSQHSNIVMHVYPADAPMLDDLEHGRIAAAMTWQPFLDAYEKAHSNRRRLQSHLLSGRHMLWNLVALYAPESEAASVVFGKGIAALGDSGKLDRLIQPYGGAIKLEPDAVGVMREPTVSSSRCDAGNKANAKSKRIKPPALYTEAQAAQGAGEYFQNCAMCHGPLLQGQEGGYPGPALKGADFADPSYDFHVSDIFRFVAKLMPAATPGSLSNKQNVDIMAFILKQNGYPAGASELTYDGAMTSDVPIRYYGN